MSRRGTLNYSVVNEAARAAQAAARRAAAERRHNEYLARVAETTRAHLARYEAIVDDVRAQGLEAFVEAELAHVASLIAEARREVGRDAESARSLSQQIGPLIGPLPRTARQRRAESRAASASPQAKAEANSRGNSEFGDAGNHPIAHVRAESQSPEPSPLVAIDAAWDEGLAEWSDMLSRDLAHADLARLRASIETESGVDPRAVKASLVALRERFDQEAADFRSAEEADAAAQARELEVDDQPLEPAESDTQDFDEATDDPEAVRREAVRAVMNALEDAGFLVQSPRLVVGESGSDEVLVVGTRPGGASASFSLTRDGGLEYDFAGYRGSSCDADIDVVMPAIEDVYGVHLSDEVVSWRNPDDLDADARPRPGRNRHA